VPIEEEEDINLNSKISTTYVSKITQYEISLESIKQFSSFA
jgi:hypothetical protein